MAVSEVSAEDEHSIEAASKAFDHMERIDPARAHRSKNPDGRGILEAGNPCQIRSGVGTPVTEESKYLGLEGFFHCFISSLKVAAPPALMAATSWQFLKWMISIAFWGQDAAQTPHPLQDAEMVSAT